jgi:hypothetical protein
MVPLTIRSKWRPFFAIVPRRSYIDGRWIMGKIYRRNVEHDIGFQIFWFVDYATAQDLVQEKLEKC